MSCPKFYLWPSILFAERSMALQWFPVVRGGWHVCWGSLSGQAWQFGVAEKPGPIDSSKIKYWGSDLSFHIKQISKQKKRYETKVLRILGHESRSTEITERGHVSWSICQLPAWPEVPDNGTDWRIRWSPEVCRTDRTGNLRNPRSLEFSVNTVPEHWWGKELESCTELRSAGEVRTGREPATSDDNDKHTASSQQPSSDFSSSW